MSSIESFPLGIARQPDVFDAAEEARLFYVAMTRARNRLYIGWGDREKKWLDCSKYETQNGSQRHFLKGSPDELFVSWPGQEKQVLNGLQDYIERKVCLGDPLELSNRWLQHEGRTVGRLSNDTVEPPQDADGHAQLRVSNVIRYTSGRYFQEHQPKYWERLHESVKDLGRFYIVLAEEA